MRSHGGELHSLARVHQDGPRAELEPDGAAEHREPLVTGVDAGLVRFMVGGQAHLGDRDAPSITLPGEQPERRTAHGLGLRANHHVFVSLRLHELVEGGSERLGDGHELLQRDPLMAGLDAAERGRGQEAACRERVQGPSAR